jgi:DNA-binding NtrC family response regulator
MGNIMAKILIIDDSAIIRTLLTEFLTDEGHAVDATEDSLEGIRMAVEGDYAACICDIHLPSKNGYEIYCEVTAQKPDLPFVITDSLPDSVSRKIKVAGAYSYLKKPFDLDQLREVLARILKPVKTK